MCVSSPFVTPGQEMTVQIGALLLMCSSFTIHKYGTVGGPMAKTFLGPGTKRTITHTSPVPQPAAKSPKWNDNSINVPFRTPPSAAGINIFATENNFQTYAPTVLTLPVLRLSRVSGNSVSLSTHLYGGSIFSFRNET